MNAKQLEKLSAPELRQLARRENIAITYLTERKKADLVRLISAALAARR